MKNQNITAQQSRNVLILRQYVRKNAAIIYAEYVNQRPNLIVILSNTYI